MGQTPEPAEDDPSREHAWDPTAVARQARLRMAARARTPWWYPPAYGVGVGGMVASLALPPRKGMLALLACLALLVGAYTLWQRTSGMRVSGLRAGRTRLIAIGIGVAVVVSFAGALLLRERYPNGEAALVSGVVLAVVAAAGSAAWDRAWRAELLAEVE